MDNVFLCVLAGSGVPGAICTTWSAALSALTCVLACGIVQAPAYARYTQLQAKQQALTVKVCVRGAGRMTMGSMVDGVFSSAEAFNRLERLPCKQRTKVR